MTTPLASSSPPSVTMGATARPDDIRTMLVRLTVALSRRRAYAPSHPMVMQAEESLHAALTSLLGRRPILTIGVAFRELLVDQVPAEYGGAAGSELAERLHRRGVGALTLQAGLSRDDLREALAWLARDPSSLAPSAHSTHGATRDEPPLLAGIAIARVAFERLSLTSDDADTKAEIAALWRALAAAAFDAETPASQMAMPEDAECGPDDLEHASAEAVGDAIAARVHHPHVARRVGVVMQTIATQLRTASPRARAEVANRLVVVLERLGRSSLAAIIRAAGSGADQRRYIAAHIDVLPATAIVHWLERTAAATEQQLSHHLLRILTKLSAHEGERRAGAGGRQEQVRTAAQALVADWSLSDPNPIEHGALLDDIATGEATRLGATPRAASPHAASAGPAALPDEVTEDARGAPDEDAVRLVVMACELDLAGADAIAAAEELIAAGHAVRVLGWLADAPGRQAAEALRAAILTPASLRRTLLREPFDPASARALLRGADLALAPVLLELLAEARVRSARGVLLQALREIGPALAPLLLPRLALRQPWYVVRNLLLLLRDVSGDADRVTDRATSRTLLGFLDHAHEQVRIEALRLLVEATTARDSAILRALDDRSPRIKAVAIEALVAPAATIEPAAGGLEARLRRDVTRRLTRLVDGREGEPDLLARAVRALAASTAPDVRDWLLAHVRRRTRFLRRPTLSTGPTVVAALEVLAARYASDPAVRPVLDLARTRDARDPRRLAVERPDVPGTR